MIRKLPVSDINKAYRIGRQNFGKELWFTKKFLLETIRTPGYHYGCYKGKELLGCILVRKFDRPKLWIFFLAVDKNSRGMGVGKKLLETVEKMGSKQYPLLFVDVSARECSFYKKMGFRRQATIKDWFGIGKKGTIYSKKITS